MPRNDQGDCDGGDNGRTGGDETVPTVEVAGRALVNPRVRDVLGLVRQRAPLLVPDVPARPRSWRVLAAERVMTRPGRTS